MRLLYSACFNSILNSFIHQEQRLFALACLVYILLPKTFEHCDVVVHVCISCLRILLDARAFSSSFYACLSVTSTNKSIDWLIDSSVDRRRCDYRLQWFVFPSSHRRARLLSTLQFHTPSALAAPAYIVLPTYWLRGTGSLISCHDGACSDMSLGSIAKDREQASSPSVAILETAIILVLQWHPLLGRPHTTWLHQVRQRLSITTRCMLLYFRLDQVEGSRYTAARLRVSDWLRIVAFPIQSLSEETH